MNASERERLVVALRFIEEAAKGPKYMRDWTTIKESLHSIERVAAQTIFLLEHSDPIPKEPR